MPLTRDKSKLWIVEETPNAVAMPITTGKEIRPLADISATIDISAPYGQASSAGGFGRHRHSSPAGRHSSQLDAPEPKVIAALRGLPKACLPGGGSGGKRDPGHVTHSGS